MQHEELTLEKECRNLARRAGWVAAKLKKNGNKGIPDDLFIAPDGRCLLVEFKKDEKQQPRPEQRVWLARFPQLAHLIGSRAAFCQLLEIEPPQ